MLNALLTHSTWLWIAACILLSLMDTAGIILVSRQRQLVRDADHHPYQPMH